MNNNFFIEWIILVLDFVEDPKKEIVEISTFLR